MPRFLSVLLAFLLASQAVAEDTDIAALFTQQQANGSLLLSALHSGQTYVHNLPRAQQRFTPASTFKILNSLIALQEQVVTDSNSRFQWDGKVRSIASWNQDQTLATAFQRSCVWCYQQLAEKIGVTTYQRYLTALHYGQLKVPFKLTQFWLDGSLQISSVEQVACLRQLQQRNLPFSPAAYQSLSEIMLAEDTADYRLWGKTGLGGKAPKQVGWYVGYVQTTSEVWFFAINLEISDPQQLPLRQQLVQQALHAKGIID